MAKDRKRKKRRVLKTIFNPRGWMAYDRVKEQGHEVADMFKDITDVQKPVRKETFEQALKRMKLTEQDVQARMKSLYLSSWIYFGMGFLVLIYGLVSLFAAKFLTFGICAIIAVLGFVLAFRDSFFYFQMKKRRLGCTVKEWVAFILRRDTSSSTELKK